MDNIKIKRWICDILLFLCFTAIAFFAGKILINQWKYKKAQKEYDTLQKAVQTEKSINWKKLKRMNKDIVAWIKVPGTKVSYPIVQGKDNSTYLHRTFHKKYNPSGCIFLDYKCKKDFMSDNNVIYQIRVSGNDCIHLLLVVMRKTITGLIFMQLKIRKK